MAARKDDFTDIQHKRRVGHPAVQSGNAMVRQKHKAELSMSDRINLYRS